MFRKDLPPLTYAEWSILNAKRQEVWQESLRERERKAEQRREYQRRVEREGPLCRLADVERLLNKEIEDENA